MFNTPHSTIVPWSISTEANGTIKTLNNFEVDRLYAIANTDNVAISFHNLYPQIQIYSYTITNSFCFYSYYQIVIFVLISIGKNF